MPAPLVLPAPSPPAPTTTQGSTFTMLKGNREETKKGSKKALVWDADSDRAFEGMKQAL